MRINDILSKPISDEFKQCDPFLGEKLIKIGKQKKLSIGNILINYHCNKCCSDYTFSSDGDLSCIRVGERLLSIDTVLLCPSCRTELPIWFLVESEKDISDVIYNRYRILKITEKFNENVTIVSSDYGDFTSFLVKAEAAHKNQLGAASIVYLRKVYEGITHQIATAQNINIHKQNSNRLRPFKDILEEVDQQAHIIPREFTENGYRLFGELSDIVHGDSIENEEIALIKYKALRRLVIGILDNISKIGK